MTDLTIIRKAKDHKILLMLSGKINEDSDFSEIKVDDYKVVIFDFSGVELINSLGIQRWISFLLTIPKDLKVVFKKCPLRIINQINLFPDFTGNRPITYLSFYAPYYCDQCEESITELLDTKKHFPDGAPLKVPPKHCPKCQEEMEFGGIEKKYLLFLKRQREAA